LTRNLFHYTIQLQLRKEDLMRAIKVADSLDREAWLTARAEGITASDAAKLAKASSIDSIVKAKFHNDFVGNSATEWGLQREEFLLNWAGFSQNTFLYASADEPRFMATPDGILMSEVDGTIQLCQAKTSSKPLTSIPPNYARQVQWEMMVMDADSVWLVWEQHQDFVPVDLEPIKVLIHRDEKVIAELKELGYELLARLESAKAFREEMNND
jgi:hypothetical protein